MEELEAVEGGEGLRVRLRAGKQLPEDDSVREDVDGGRVLDATRGGGGEHLGRHVLDRADERCTGVAAARRSGAVARWCGGAVARWRGGAALVTGHLGGVRRPAREAKVGDLDGDAAAVRVEAEKDVGGREVAVDDAVVVKVLQPLGDLPHTQTGHAREWGGGVWGCSVWGTGRAVCGVRSAVCGVR
eukprot:6376161-Prymnesium_polylepis.1